MKRSHILICFGVVITILIYFFVSNLKENGFSIFSIKQILSIFLCFTIIIYWAGYFKVGIILYNIVLLVLIILSFFMGYSLRNIFIILLFVILDYFQIRRFIHQKKENR